ncbi:hypothetical protein [Microcoleus sp. F4-D5]|uniref:hypothetical protein n=1 Tax=Microcoleus sp. F4-D5 TaxID=2818760 RepID=UPI002FD31C21
MMEIRQLWQEFNDEQAEKLSGGEIEGCLAGSAGFSDVARPSTSQAPSSCTFYPGSSLSKNSNVEAEGKIRGTLMF